MSKRCFYCAEPATTRLRYASGYVGRRALCDQHAAQIDLTEYQTPPEKVSVATKVGR